MRLRIAVVWSSRDSLRSLILASISVLILINSTFFLSALSFQIDDKKWAMLHTTGNLVSSAGSTFRVRILAEVILGRILFSPSNK